MINIERISHLVLPVASIERCCRFYSEKLGMEVITLVDKSKFLSTGLHKIRLLQLGVPTKYNPRNVFPGSSEICFTTKTPLKDVEQMLIRNNIPLFSNGNNDSNRTAIYLHDPDGNLLIITNE